MTIDFFGVTDKNQLKKIDLILTTFIENTDMQKFTMLFALRDLIRNDN